MNAENLISRFPSFRRSVPAQALADFFDHLSTLLASGIPLLQALDVTITGRPGNWQFTVSKSGYK
jgi:type II secretory pathway component PulF